MAAESSKYAELHANNELCCLHIKNILSETTASFCQKSLSSQGFIETIFSPVAFSVVSFLSPQLARRRCKGLCRCH